MRSDLPGELTYAWNPADAEHDPSVETWERIRREGGLVYLDGKVVGHVSPAVDAGEDDIGTPIFTANYTPAELRDPLDRIEGGA